MTDPAWLHEQALKTRARLSPRLDSAFADYRTHSPAEWQTFQRRLDRHFERLFSDLWELYGTQYDFFYHLEALLHSLARSFIERPADLRALDESREADPTWFASEKMLGGVCYVDLFAGNLEGIRAQLPYFKELGLTYLHLMPLFKAPAGENDGGYAVSSYREVNPSLGTMQQLADLARAFRAEGISLVLDFVFNHTSDEHDWAKAARLAAQTGNAPDAEKIYRIFPDRVLPDQYQPSLREIFPSEHPGAFTYDRRMDRWVWTTFHAYQWDLNYDNPQVFIKMTEELAFLANQGIDVLRMDAVAFIWKRMGTNCENLPEAHTVIQAFNAAVQIVAPAMLFKSEAIVHPDDVVKYVSPQECQLSYNPLLMALLWNALATREVRLLALSMRERYALPAGTAWVNYVRCHDDIGWTFSDEDAARLWIDAADHRRFLNSFYTGRFPGSFARGLPFQENRKTGDCRISGTCASLAGLEKALKEETPREVELAIRRILLIHAIMMTAGGIPLLYLGDEIGTLNDYSYRQDPAKASDSRWVHRPAADPARYALRRNPQTAEGKIYAGLKRLIAMRKSNPEFAGQSMQVIETCSDAVLGYIRPGTAHKIIVLANFSEKAQIVPAECLYTAGFTLRDTQYCDLATGSPVNLAYLRLDAYEWVVLRSEEG